MSVTLDPRIAAALEAFARRRRRLMAVRGFCAAVLALLACAGAAMLADGVWIIDDGMRLVMGAAVYVAFGAVLWLECLRPLLARTDRRGLARLVERLMPSVREDLLSAVELADTPRGVLYDSEEFRAYVQRSVADRVEGLRPEALLPPRLFRRRVVPACAVVMVMAALCPVPGLRLGQRLARVMLPLANMARVAVTEVTLLEPSHEYALVPQGDPLHVVARVAGQGAGDARIELRREGTAPEYVALQAAGEDGLRAAALATGPQPFRFRVRAGDAVTRMVRVETRVRPYVRLFDITYHPPRYTLRPSAEETGRRRGDVRALEGTRVSLVLHADQEIAAGRLEIAQEGADVVQAPLVASAPATLRGEFTITAAGQYKVHLRAASTGFDSGEYSPRHRIEAIKDLAPVVTLTAPAGDQVVAPGGVVALRGTARDDIALSGAALEVQVNGGPWAEVWRAQEAVVLAAGAGELALGAAIDLHDLAPDTGDVVAARFSAVDGRGAKGASRTVTLTVAAAGFALPDASALDAKRQLFDRLGALEIQAQQLAAKAAEVRGRLEEDDTAVAAAGAAAGLSAVAVLLARAADAVSMSAGDVLRREEGGARSHGAALVGETIARLAWEHARAAARHGARMGGETCAERARTHLDRAWEAARQAAALAGDVRAFYGEMLEADELEAHLHRMVALDAYLGRPGARVDAAALAQAARIEEHVREHGDRVKARGADAGHLHRLEDVFARVRKVIDADEGAFGTRASKHTSAVLRTFLRTFDDALKRADQSFTVLGREVRALVDVVGELGGAERRFAAQEAEMRRRASVRGQEEEDAERNAAWETALGVGERCAAFEGLRADGSARAAADIELTLRALRALRATLGAGGDDAEAAGAALDRVAGAHAVLDAGGGVERLAAVLDAMADGERWRPGDPRARTTTPMDWDHVRREFADVPGRLRAASLPAKAADALRHLAGGRTAAQVGLEMKRRRSAPDGLNAQVAPLEELAAGVRAVEDMLRDHMARARRVIEEEAPNLGEMMRAAAASAAEVRDRARHAAALEADADVPHELPALGDAHRSVASEVHAITHALGHDANVQDMLSEAGRVRARDADGAAALLAGTTRDASHALADAQAAAGEAGLARERVAAAAGFASHLAVMLEEFAAHFDALDSGGDVQASRAAMRAAESSAGAAVAESFARADALAALARAAPEEALRALEAQLAADGAMQRELSAVAGEALAAARERLEDAVRTETQVARALERSGEQTESRASRLEKIGRSAGEMAARDVPAVGALAGQAEHAMSQSLERAVQALREAQGLSQSGEDMESMAFAVKAEHVGRALNGAAKALEGARDASVQAAAASGADRDMRDAAVAAGEAAGGVAGEVAALVGAARGLAVEAAMQALDDGKVFGGAARDHAPVPGQVAEAGGMVARAGRHEGRLGRDARAEELGNAADGVARLVREELAAADAALRKGADADAARGAVEAARAQLQDALASMPSGAVAPGQAGMPGEASSGAPGAPSAGADLDRSVSSALARALDALDAALHGAASVPAGPADDSGAPGMQGALDALLAAAAEQAAAMRRARAGDSMASGPGAEVEGVRPGGGDGAQLSSREVAAGQLPLAAARSGGVWGKLPEKMARELMEGMREDAPPEYREMIEIYFRVIAERAGSTVP